MWEDPYVFCDFSSYLSLHLDRTLQKVNTGDQDQNEIKNYIMTEVMAFGKKTKKITLGRSTKSPYLKILNSG